VRQLVEVASEAIENRAVGGERRPELIDIPASLLAAATLSVMRPVRAELSRAAPAAMPAAIELSISPA
jgi:hypothetical protein